MDSVTIANVVKNFDDFHRQMGQGGGYSQPSTPDLHRKAVAKRKKRKKGGHK